MARRGTKKLTTWEYDDGNGTTLKMSVRQTVVPTYESGLRHETVTLRVTIPELDIDEKDPDINALRERVFAAIKTKLVLKWEWFLLIKTGGYGHDIDRFPGATWANPSVAAEVEFKVTRLQIARRPDGTTCWRQADRSSTHEGWPEVGQEVDSYSHRKTGNVQAVIPDTPENRGALAIIGQSFVVLRQHIQDLLGPEKVQETIAYVAASGSMPGLPSPGPEFNPFQAIDED